MHEKTVSLTFQEIKASLLNSFLPRKMVTLIFSSENDFFSSNKHFQHQNESFIENGFHFPSIGMRNRKILKKNINRCTLLRVYIVWFLLTQKRNNKTWSKNNNNKRDYRFSKCEIPRRSFIRYLLYFYWNGFGFWDDRIQILCSFCYFIKEKKEKRAPHSRSIWYVITLFNSSRKRSKFKWQ